MVVRLVHLIIILSCFRQFSAHILCLKQDERILGILRCPGTLPASAHCSSGILLSFYPLILLQTIFSACTFACFSALFLRTVIGILLSFYPFILLQTFFSAGIFACFSALFLSSCFSALFLRTVSLLLFLRTVPGFLMNTYSYCNLLVLHSVYILQEKLHRDGFSA